MARRTPLLVAAMLFAAGSAGLALTVPGEHAFAPLASFTLRHSPPATSTPLVALAPVGSAGLLTPEIVLPVATSSPEQLATQSAPALVAAVPGPVREEASPASTPALADDEEATETPTPAPVRAAMVQRDSEPPSATATATATPAETATPPVLRIPGVANGEPASTTASPASATATPTPASQTSGQSRRRQP